MSRCLQRLFHFDGLDMKQDITESRVKELGQISQFLCFLLRHKPQAANLNMDTSGWVAVDQLISNISEAKKTKLSFEELQFIVESDEEGRYTFNSENSSIRCQQGHSLDWVNIQYESYSPNSDLYHGTKSESVASILSNGLFGRKRNYVHLSVNIQKATRVGKRHSKEKMPVILVIDKNAPVDFKISDNGVILVDFVPPQYISILKEDKD
ncbi:RNA 2'-phosphotransferase [Vibrio parahaemolyticus]|nr:RNA 2'-phosphotransferase [Vibrio parahaemolyticus]